MLVIFDFAESINVAPSQGNQDAFRRFLKDRVDYIGTVANNVQQLLLIYCALLLGAPADSTTAAISHDLRELPFQLLRRVMPISTQALLMVSEVPRLFGHTPPKIRY